MALGSSIGYLRDEVRRQNIFVSSHTSAGHQNNSMQLSYSPTKFANVFPDYMIERETLPCNIA